MRVECAWCGKNMPSKGDATDAVSHSICLQCVEELLYAAGEEAELESWALAFKVERMHSNLQRDADEGPYGGSPKTGARTCRAGQHMAEGGEGR